MGALGGRSSGALRRCLVPSMVADPPLCFLAPVKEETVAPRPDVGGGPAEHEASGTQYAPRAGRGTIGSDRTVGRPIDSGRENRPLPLRE